MPIPHWTGAQQCVKARYMLKPILESHFVCLDSTLGTKFYIYQDLVRKEKNPSIINIRKFLKGAKNLNR